MGFLQDQERLSRAPPIAHVALAYVAEATRLNTGSLNFARNSVIYTTTEMQLFGRGSLIAVLV